MLLFSEGWTMGFDGPGRRYIFYLKGCNLLCPWCASPESISQKCEILYYPERTDKPPVHVCPYGAVSEKGLDRTRCATCPTFDCATRWRHKAFELVGYERTPEQIIQRVLSLASLAEGITFGGGEPTLQMEELRIVLTALREQGIHTTVESNATTDRFPELPGLPDLLFCDLKRPQDTRRENLREAAQRQENLIVRIPLVPGENNSPECLSFFKDLLGELRRERPTLPGQTDPLPLVVEILPLHHLGKVKYNALGRPYPMEGVPVPDGQAVEEVRQKLRQTGVVIQ